MADPVTLIEIVTFLSQLNAAAQALPPADTQHRPNTPRIRELVMPESPAELGKIVLKCYHPSGRFVSIDMIQKPWVRGKNYGADKSVFIRINWRGALSNSPYYTLVGLVGRRGHFRAAVQGDNAPFPPSGQCRFNDWVQIARKAGSVTHVASTKAGGGDTDLNRARKEIENLIESATAVALGGPKVNGNQEAIQAELIATLAKRVLAVKAAMQPRK